MAAPSGETSQTLDRGLTVLKLLAKSQDGLTVADIAEQLGTARPIVYRLLRTLEGHNLVGREDSRYVLGFGIAELAGVAAVVTTLPAENVQVALPAVPLPHAIALGPVRLKPASGPDRSAFGAGANPSTSPLPTCTPLPDSANGVWFPGK